MGGYLERCPFCPLGQSYHVEKVSSRPFVAGGSLAPCQVFLCSQVRTWRQGGLFATRTRSSTFTGPAKV